MYVKITNGEVAQFPYEIRDFRNEHLTTSFPKEIPTEVLNSFGIYEVVSSPMPDVDQLLHQFTMSIQLVDGVWTQVWEYEQEDIGIASKAMRRKRNDLLAQSDWTQGKDIPEATSTAWATYRQALRDIPTQAGFPYNVTWPQEP